MCNPAIVMVGMMVVGGLVSAKASKDRANAEKRGLEHEAEIAERNLQIGEAQANDAINRGRDAARNHALKIESIRQSQRARFAAAGLDVGEGTPLHVLMSTNEMGEIDLATIRDNAAKEAWFYRENARTGRLNADFYRDTAGRVNPGQAYYTSLLGSAGSAASSWYSYGKRA